MKNEHQKHFQNLKRWLKNYQIALIAITGHRHLGTPELSFIAFYHGRDDIQTASGKFCKSKRMA